jgi:hypothetical protein
VNKYGRPVRVGQVARQAGAVATAIKTNEGLRWQVRRERDGRVCVTERLAHTRHWVKP